MTSSKTALNIISPQSCKCNMDGSIRLEMSRHPPSMKPVVNIVIAVNRMKHVKTVSSEFGAEQVLDMIMDRVIQGTTTKLVCC